MLLVIQNKLFLNNFGENKFIAIKTILKYIFEKSTSKVSFSKKDDELRKASFSNVVD